jgi:hypothetical protein
MHRPLIGPLAAATLSAILNEQHRRHRPGPP